MTPLYGHSPIANELPHASSLCGACKEACPVKIDIPTMLIKLRREFKFTGRMGALESIGVSLGSRVLASPLLYRTSSWLGRAVQRIFARDGWIAKAPGPLADWTLNRDLPALARKPFRKRWRERRRSGRGMD